MAFRVWKGKHRATNGSGRVRRIATLTGSLMPARGSTYEERTADRAYIHGKGPAHYPVPAIRGHDHGI